MMHYTRSVILTTTLVATVCGSTFAVARDDVAPNLTDQTKHRLHVALSGTPDGFREALIASDVYGLIDDIAVPAGLEDADLAIFYFADVSELEELKFFDELESIQSRIMEGVGSPAYTLGLTVGGQDGPRPLRLFFYNVSEARKGVEARGIRAVGIDGTDPRCLAARIYQLSIFDNTEVDFAELSANCEN